MKREEETLNNTTRERREYAKRDMSRCLWLFFRAIGIGLYLKTVSFFKALVSAPRQHCDVRDEKNHLSDFSFSFPNENKMVLSLVDGEDNWREQKPLWRTMMMTSLQRFAVEDSRSDDFSVDFCFRVSLPRTHV